MESFFGTWFLFSAYLVGLVVNGGGVGLGGVGRGGGGGGGLVGGVVGFGGLIWTQLHCPSSGHWGCSP